MNHTSTTWPPWQGGHQLHQLLPAEGARCLEVPDKKPGLTPAGTLGAAWNWRSQSCQEVAKAWPRGTVEESERGRVARDGTLHNCRCQVPFYLAHTSPSEVPPGPQAVQNASPQPPAPRNASLLSSGYQQLRIYQNPFLLISLQWALSGCCTQHPLCFSTGRVSARPSVQLSALSCSSILLTLFPYGPPSRPDPPRGLVCTFLRAFPQNPQPAVGLFPLCFPTPTSPTHNSQSQALMP